MNSNHFTELAKISQDSFLNRRTYEWKVNFSLWSAIGLFTYFALSNASVAKNLPLFALAVAYSVLFLIYALLWQIPMRQGFEMDKAWKHYYMHKAEGVLDQDRPTGKVSICKWNQLSYFFAQSLITLSFLLGSFFLIYSSQTSVSHSSKEIHSYVLPDSSYQITIYKLK
jgi:hypothetical protein